jgi:hypothetical protein
MSTIPHPTPRVKPVRRIRLALAPSADHAGVVRIHQGKEEDSYLLEPFAADFGRAFRLVKEDGEAYHVNLNGRQSSCECKGFLRWHHCKHVEGLQALVSHGLLLDSEAEHQAMAEWREREDDAPPRPDQLSPSVCRTLTERGAA